MKNTFQIFLLRFCCEFIFNDNATGNGNIVTNYAIPQYILDIQKKYVETLEEKIKTLEAEISKLKKGAER